MIFSVYQHVKISLSIYHWFSVGAGEVPEGTSMLKLKYSTILSIKSALYGENVLQIRGVSDNFSITIISGNRMFLPFLFGARHTCPKSKIKRNHRKGKVYPRIFFNFTLSLLTHFLFFQMLQSFLFFILLKSLLPLNDVD